MMVVMLMLLLHNQLKELSLKVVVALEGIQDLFSRDLIKWGCDDGGLVVVLTDELYCCLDLGLISLICSGKNDGSCILDLIDEELTKILDVNLSLGYVNNCYCAVELHVFV